jgi:hypothetical protein
MDGSSRSNRDRLDLLQALPGDGVARDQSRQMMDRQLTHLVRLIDVPLQCKHCRHQTWLTAGTVLAASKLPLTTWFLALYLLTQQKNAISAMGLMRRLGVSYNPAWSLKHKLLQTMLERDANRQLPGVIEAGMFGHDDPALLNPAAAAEAAVSGRARPVRAFSRLGRGKNACEHSGD